MTKHGFFVGVDVSKETLDVTVVSASDQSVLYHERYENTRNGIKKLFSQAKRKSKTEEWDLMFCLEHTGVYAMPLCYFLSCQQVDFALVPGVEIQRSVGLKRGKSDKADSKDIALYACMKAPQLKVYKLPERVLVRMKLLLSFRERLIRAKTMFQRAASEMNGFLDKSLIKEVASESQSIEKTINRKIAKVDELLEELIQSDENIQNAFKLVTSVPGIGLQTACYLIVYTRCFTAFENARQLACYAGIAPFEYSSGSSIKGRKKVSHLANKKLKSLLSLCALNAARVDKELRQYYLRKKQEGKNGMLVLNAIRNKLVARIFATVKRGTPYVALANHLN